MQSSHKADLTKARILIADGDAMIAEVLKQTLYHMGLVNIIRAKSGRDAFGMMRDRSFDILITEWEMDQLDGIKLVRHLRYEEETRLALLPVIMLTGRAEREDVVKARDTGVTEFMVKPFTANSVFKRLEYVIDFPRDFIVAPRYVGPDRRRDKLSSNLEESGMPERRLTLPRAIPEPKKIPALGTAQKPYKIIPSYAIRKRMGMIERLNKTITPEVLESAQAQIASFQDESLKWIAEDMSQLEQSFQIMSDRNHQEVLEDAMSALLSIKSRAGTFGFMLTSNVAFSLYSFLRNKFIFGNVHHLMVAHKHIEVMKIILARNAAGQCGLLEKQLVEGLALLVQKFQDNDIKPDFVPPPYPDKIAHSQMR